MSHIKGAYFDENNELVRGYLKTDPKNEETWVRSEV